MDLKTLAKQAQDEIDRYDAIGQRVDVSCLSSIQEMRNTQQGIMTIKALEAYGSSLAMLSGENSAQKREQKKKDLQNFNNFLVQVLSLQDLLFEDYLQAAHDYVENAEKQVEIVGQYIEANDKAQGQAQLLVNSLGKSLEEEAAGRTKKELATDEVYQDKRRRVNDINEGMEKIAQASANLGDQWESLQRSLDKLQEKKTNLSVMCGIPDRDSDACDVARSEYEQARDQFEKSSDLIVKGLGIVGGHYNVLIDGIESYGDEYGLSQEQREHLDDLKDTLKEMEDFKQQLIDQKLDADQISKHLQHFRSALNENNQVLQKMHHSAPEGSEAKEMIAGLMENNRVMADDLNEDMDQALKKFKELEEKRDRLKDEYGIFKEAAGLKSAAEGQDRKEYLFAARADDNWLGNNSFGRTWEFIAHHVGENLWTQTLGLDETDIDSYVQTSDGHVVFEDEGQYFYYPDPANPNHKVEVTDKLEIAKIEIQAWDKESPKMFGSDSAYGNNIVGFFANTGRNLVKDIVTKEEVERIKEAAREAEQELNEAVKKVEQSKDDLKQKLGDVREGVLQSGLSFASELESGGNKLSTVFAMSAAPDVPVEPGPTVEVKSQQGFGYGS